MTSLEGSDFPGVATSDVDRVAIADLKSIKDYRLMHMNELTTHQIYLVGGAHVVVTVNSDGRIGALSCQGQCRHRLEGRTLVLEG